MKKVLRNGCETDRESNDLETAFGKVQTGNGKPETGNQKPEAAKARSGSRGPPAETGNRKPEAEMVKNVEKKGKKRKKWEK